MTTVTFVVLNRRGTFLDPLRIGRSTKVRTTENTWRRWMDRSHDQCGYLRNVQQRLAQAFAHLMDVVPLLFSDWDANVVSQLELVEQPLEYE